MGARWLVVLLVVGGCASGAPPDQQIGFEVDAASDCEPQCNGAMCGQIEVTCGTVCGDACNAGCTMHCSNTVQDCDETGVDCGGSCAACSSDPCAGTVHCSNGVQDCGETALNCGGDCLACVDPCAGTAHCANGVQDCDEAGMDCGGAACTACAVGSGCGDDCYYYDGSCSIFYIDACDGCDMGCEFHDPDCDDAGSTCLAACSCLFGISSWYCDGFDDCADPACECAGE